MVEVVEVLTPRRFDPTCRTDRPAYALSTTDIVTALVGSSSSYLEVNACERMINYWRYAGVIKPSIHVSRGSGTRMLWSHDDLERVRKIWALREQFHRIGMNLSKDVVAAIWNSLVKDEPWEMRITIDNTGITSTVNATSVARLTDPVMPALEAGDTQ